MSLKFRAGWDSQYAEVKKMLSEKLRAGWKPSEIRVKDGLKQRKIDSSEKRINHRQKQKIIRFEMYDYIHLSLVMICVTLTLVYLYYRTKNKR